MTTPNNYLAQIKVVGVGGGGSSAVERMIEAGITGVEFIAVNTDAQALFVMSSAETKLQIGREVTNGLGAGADPTVGKKSAEDHYEEIKEVLDGADMVFVTAGEGGGTGTGAAPIVAKAAKEVNALTIGIVTKPFDYEMKRRKENAEAGIEELRNEVDTLIVIPNQRLLEVLDPNISTIDAYIAADQVLRSGVQGITDLLTNAGLINLDFADLKAVMKGAGTALMGIGSATGEDRTMKAVQEAVSSQLLETSIEGAHGVLVSFQAASDLKLHEIADAVQYVADRVHPEANLIYGHFVNDKLVDEVRVTVFAAGFDPEAQKQAKLMQEQENLEQNNEVIQFKTTDEREQEIPTIFKTTDEFLKANSKNQDDNSMEKFDIEQLSTPIQENAENENAENEETFLNASSAFLNTNLGQEEEKEETNNSSNSFSDSQDSENPVEFM